jgi:hypothetical protein
MENFELHSEMMITCRQMLDACEVLRKHARAYATAHRDFKREHATALLRSTSKTVREREAEADVKSDMFRFNNYLEEGLMQAALEHVRSLRAKLSALQTMGSLNKEESQYYRTGPQVGP